MPLKNLFNYFLNSPLTKIQRLKVLIHIILISPGLEIDNDYRLFKCNKQKKVNWSQYIPTSVLAQQRVSLHPGRHWEGQSLLSFPIFLKLKTKSLLF